jgi:hypothetical protein
LTYRQSLRYIEVCFLAQAAKLYHCFYLLSYRPELNSEVKFEFRPEASCLTAANDHMTMLEINPRCAASICQDPHLKYAA